MIGVIYTHRNNFMKVKQHATDLSGEILTRYMPPTGTHIDPRMHRIAKIPGIIAWPL